LYQILLRADGSATSALVPLKVVGHRPPVGRQRTDIDEFPQLLVIAVILDGNPRLGAGAPQFDSARFYV
jgi:hypothetical protein